MSNTMAKPQVRAACYCRISSDPQDRREGVERQREDTTALCEVKGWAPAAYYIDNDRSASNGKDRPEWDRLLADIEAGKIDAVAAWDQDRGWRMMHELEDLRKFFQKLGRPVPLATTGQGDIDLYSPTGVLAAQIKTAVSEHEVAMMRVRQLRAARQRAERGLPKWREAFGYLSYTGPKQDDDGTREPDPETAPLVKQAYASLLAGSSISDIARDFNTAGALGLNGNPWSPSTMTMFMRAPRNAGLRAHHGEILGKGTWTPLVDESVWRAAQTILNAEGRAPGRKTVRKHLLTGVLQCGKPGCGGHLSGMQTIDKRITYACKVCRGVSVRAQHVQPLVYEMVGGRLAMPDAADLLRAEIHDEVEAEALRVEANALLTRLDEIADERADGLLTGAQAARATERIQAKLGAIEKAQQDAERLRVFADIPLGRPEAVAAVEALTPDRFRAVVALLLVVTVDPVGKGSHVFDPERVRFEWR
ncbi:MAG: recombinase family protein [Mycobacterium sp.]